MKTVKIVEVGPRDGLQNESLFIPTATKIDLIHRLSDAHIQHIETTAFVSPSRVPQMADQKEVLLGIQKKNGVIYSALTPNLQGFLASQEAKADEVAIFASASETFSQKNINASIQESLLRFAPLMKVAKTHGIRVRGYVSCVISCPYEGAIHPHAVAQVTQSLLELGCHEISLGDTIGVGTPSSIARMIDAVAKVAPLHQLAGHFHDTYGMAIANIMMSLNMGLRCFDSSVGGLGGCPYAPGAGGNVATEDVLYLLEQEGYTTGINLKAVTETAQWISERIGRSLTSKVGRALQASRALPKIHFS